MDRDMAIKIADALNAIKTSLAAIKTAVETIAENTAPDDSSDET